MLDTFLFDLDGTLLPLDTDEFVGAYFQALGMEFESISHPKVLISNLVKATENMLANSGQKTNCEVFIESFGKLVDGKIDIYMERFNHFYENGYLKIKSITREEPLVKKSIQILKDKGYNLVVATNPLFPEDAVYKRIQWAGLDINDFMYVTSYEQCCFCKPNINYYKEVLNAINKEAKQCIMVGNDVEEDIIASELGMQTYLITNHMINRSNNDIKSTYTGSYQDFYNFVSGLECI